MLHVDTYLSHLKPQIAELDQIIKDNQTFLLIGHRNPDGDCVGSLLGFGRRLENKGKIVHYITPNAVSEQYERLEGVEKINYIKDNPNFLSLPEADVSIFLDLSGPALLEGAEDELKQLSTSVTACIDHHVNPSLNANLIIDDTNSSSCCELVREIINYLDAEKVDTQIANYCYVGFVTDTGGSLSNGLEFEKDTIRSCENIIHMIRYGLEKRKILLALGNITLKKLQFANLLLSRTQTKNNILRSRYSNGEKEEFGDEGGAGLAMDLMKKVEGYPVVARFCIYEDGLSCSLRTIKPYNVQSIAASFGGGGHILASGFKLAGIYDQSSIEDIIIQIDNMLGQQNSNGI